MSMNVQKPYKRDSGGYLLDNYELSAEYTEINAVSGSCEDDVSQQALDKVKSLLKPVNIFLVLIGWRPIVVPPYKKKRYFVARAWNMIWPVIVFLMLTSTVLLQILSCDKRNEYYTPDKKSHDQLLKACLRNLISYYIFPTILILISYTYMLYLIRRDYSEHFENMLGRVFLLYTQKRGRLTQTTLKRTVNLFFVVSITWLIYSIILLVIKSAVNLSLNQSDLYDLIIETSHEANYTHTDSEIVLIILEPIPIALYDLFYVAQLLSYSIQAQILIYYFNGINDSIKFKGYKTLQDAMKEIGQAAEILSAINGKVAVSVSLVMINIAMFLVNTFHQLWNSVHGKLNPLALTYEVLDLLRWIVILYVPIFQAMLITVNAKRIMKVGLLLKTRPFGYEEISQEDLDYFQLYTSHLRLHGKLFGIPVRPRGVAIFVLVLLFAALLWVGFDPDLGKVYWV